MCARHWVFVVAIPVSVIGLWIEIMPSVGAVREPPLQVDALVAGALKENPEIERPRPRWPAAQAPAPPARAPGAPPAPKALAHYPHPTYPGGNGHTTARLRHRLPYP